jgi:hypothetical protein
MWGKPMEHGEQVDQLLECKKDIFHLIGLLRICPFAI